MNNCLDAPIASILRMILSVDSSVHLVGGAIRDNFLGRPHYADLDLVLDGDGFEISRHVADQIGKDAAFVPLDKKGRTGRVVFSGFPAIVDISSFKGKDIVEDLSRRDFTINSMAVRVSDFLNTGFTRLVDPCGGRQDLMNRRVRACSANSFQDDPVRILRAFRFSSSLGFTITPETLTLLPGSVSLLTSIAYERIRDELFAILLEPNSAATLEHMDVWKIIDILFPEIRPSKGCAQNDYHHLDVWSHSLETVRQLEAVMATLPMVLCNVADKVKVYIDSEPVRGRPRKAILKLAALLHDTGKPWTKTIDNRTGRVHFFGHEKISKQLFDDIGYRLKLARREIEMIGRWISGHMRPSILTCPSVSKRAIHRILREFRLDAIGLFLLFLADLGASLGPHRGFSDAEDALSGVGRALDEYFGSTRIRRAPLLNGHELMDLFGIQQGPSLGKIIRRLGELQDAGDITSHDQAVMAARRILAGDTESQQF